MPIKEGTQAALRELFTVDQRPPDDDRTLVNELFGDWYNKRMEERGVHERSSTAPFYASDLPSCARWVAYNVLDRMFPEESPGPSNPPDMAAQWRFFLGETVHDAVQETAKSWGNEVRAVLKDDEGTDLVSCRADMVRERDGVVVEIKSEGGFGFKKAATSFSGGPTGPKNGHITQLALTVKALIQNGVEVHKGMVLLVALENLSRQWVEKDDSDDPTYPFSAPYTFEVDELLAVADEILEWYGKILDKLETGELPPRILNDPEIPRYAKVIDPSNGSWIKVDGEEVSSKGKAWFCQYCAWQDMCVEDMRIEGGE